MDWQIIFFTSLLLGVVVVIVGVSVYFRADKFLSTEVSVFTAPIQAQADINNLKYILGEFADNERKQSSLQKGYVGVADPSR